MSTQLFRVPLPEPKLDPAARKLPHFLRVEEVADLLRCKKRTIYDMVEQRRIPYRRVGGRLLFDLAEIIEFTKKG
jgi:excisionase family DNA binding protein